MLALCFALAACNPSDSNEATNPIPDNMQGAQENSIVGGSSQEANVSSHRDVINVGIDGNITNYFPWQSCGSGGWEAAVGAYYPADEIVIL